VPRRRFKKVRRDRDADHLIVMVAGAVEAWRRLW
jgi:hypothetical protein